jgi:very-short-patch-repair endonuclease
MELKSKALEDHKFRQQHLIDNLLILCLSKKLVVEVDGEPFYCRTNSAG